MSAYKIHQQVDTHPANPICISIPLAIEDMRAILETHPRPISNQQCYLPMILCHAILQSTWHNLPYAAYNKPIEGQKPTGLCLMLNSYPGKLLPLNFQSASLNMRTPIGTQCLCNPAHREHKNMYCISTNKKPVSYPHHFKSILRL